MKYLIILMLIFMITASSCTKRHPDYKKSEPLSQQEIIVAAQKYFQEESPSLNESSQMFYDEGNSIWKENGHAFAEMYPGEKHKLESIEGYDYQVVRFSPKEDTDWFDLSCVLVFVDRNNGDVITSLWGKYTSRKDYDTLGKNSSDDEIK